MRTFTVEFRGEKVGVCVQHYDDDPDTGAHSLEWSFEDDELNCLELTDEETTRIEIELAEKILDCLQHEHFPDDVI